MKPSTFHKLMALSVLVIAAAACSRHSHAAGSQTVVTQMAGTKAWQDACSSPKIRVRLA